MIMSVGFKGANPFVAYRSAVVERLGLVVGPVVASGISLLVFANYFYNNIKIKSC